MDDYCGECIQVGTTETSGLLFMEVRNSWLELSPRRHYSTSSSYGDNIQAKVEVPAERHEPSLRWHLQFSTMYREDGSGSIPR